MAILYSVTKSKDIYTLVVSQDTDYVLNYFCGGKKTKVIAGTAGVTTPFILPVAKDGAYNLVLSASGENDVIYDFNVFYHLQNSLILDIYNILNCCPISDACDQKYNVCLDSGAKQYLQYKDFFVKFYAFQGLYFDEISPGLSNVFSNFLSASIMADRCSFQTSLNKMLQEECIYGSAKDSSKIMMEFVGLFYYVMYFIEKNLATGDQDELDFVDSKFLVDTIPDSITSNTCLDQTETETLFNETLAASNNAPTVSDYIITVPSNLPANLLTYIFTGAEFTNNYSDIQGDAANKVKFDILPVRGTFRYDGVDVVAGQEYLISNSDKFVYEATINEVKSIFDILTFQINDDNPLTQLYSTMSKVTINSAAYVNQPISQLGDLILNKGNRVNHVFTINDFTTSLTPPYVDPEGDTLDAIRIDTLPAGGVLKLSGVPVSATDIIPAASITGGLFIFEAPNQNAIAANEFNFSARDSGSLQWVN